MSEITRKIAILGCLLFTGFCFWKAGMGLIGGADASVLTSAQATLSPAATFKRAVTTPIQQMRPGMRIVGWNPLRIQTEPTIDPTPEGWRLISVRMLKEDGTYFEAELLRPLSWIYRHHAQPGAVIQLNMPEMYVVGAAEVLSISDCPPIDPGDGPVVISTFKNVSHNVLNIYVEGETEPIGVTAGHPIWSEDRQAFIHSDQLQPGERMRSAVGKTVRITSIEIRAGPEPVYNLEVAGEHVYSVTNSGLLVHNIGCEDLSTTIDVYSSNHLVSQFDTINAPRSKQWGPAHGAGPLGEDVAKTFRGGSYVETKLSEPVTLYRVYGGKAGELGPYWTRTKPTGPLQSRLDSALLSEWGNTARNVTTIQVPRGTTVFEGFAAPQVGKAKPFETIIGGGNQVCIPRVNPDWVMR
ncbi:hypothetical protein Mal35_20510 [Gimesia maris]|uniref:polymorphic toxin-type HINT domain-containing protein n=1 Tax=Gimesia maris TaxID=122 RepID=UPI00118C6515|nr:polymorphic toxin-type HINT domain-containing protein [Gimesia maris]QDT78602.1 hypothetical protein Mal35_20510 [Gimesia maris]